MSKRKFLKEAEEKGLIESVDYYYYVENNIRPLLDYLDYNAVKSIRDRIQKTKSVLEKENIPPCLSLGWAGEEYLIAVDLYLSRCNENKKATAYTDE